MEDGYISSSEGTAGGYKELIVMIKGEGVYSKLKYEAGTHRVQRVPETETSKGEFTPQQSLVAG